MRRSHSIEVDNLIRQRYPFEGSTGLSRELGLTQESIRRIARRLGVSTTPEVRHRIRTASRPANSKYVVDATQFINVTTPEVAYILGLIWADGHIAPTSTHSGLVTIHNVTADVLDIQSVFLKTGDWRFYTQRSPRKTWQPQTQVTTSGAALFNHLRAHDYTTKSAAPTKILSTIPEHLRHYWWRGYFDGDGNLYLGRHCHQFSFSAGYEQDWSFVRDLCEKLGVKGVVCQSISKKGYKSSVFRVSGIINCQKICDYLYQGVIIDGIGLKRKRLLYTQLSQLKPKLKVSPYEGVSLVRKTGRWRALIVSNALNGLKGRGLSLGCFDTAEEARDARARYITEHSIPQYQHNKDKRYGDVKQLAHTSLG